MTVVGCRPALLVARLVGLLLTRRRHRPGPLKFPGCQATARLDKDRAGLTAQSGVCSVGSGGGGGSLRAGGKRGPGPSSLGFSGCSGHLCRADCKPAAWLSDSGLVSP